MPIHLLLRIVPIAAATQRDTRGEEMPLKRGAHDEKLLERLEARAQARGELSDEEKETKLISVNRATAHSVAEAEADMRKNSAPFRDKKYTG